MAGFTLAAPASLENEIRKSRFLARAASVDTPAAALRWLDAAADRDATHNCWACRIGQHYRFSDDGEPAGTAGKPILAAIDGQGLDSIVVVVTRWYGGIKLGAGGLARAYGGTAAQCLRVAPRQALVDYAEAWLHCGFTDVGTAYNLLAAHAGEKLDERFDSDGVRLHVRLAVAHVDTLAATLRDATRGRSTLRPVDSAGPAR